MTKVMTKDMLDMTIVMTKDVTKSMTRYMLFRWILQDVV